MSVAAFAEPEAGYLCHDVATFSASFHIIKESSNFNRSIERGLVPRGRSSRAKGGPSKRLFWLENHLMNSSLEAFSNTVANSYLVTASLLMPSSDSSHAKFGLAGCVIQGISR